MSDIYGASPMEAAYAPPSGAPDDYWNRLVHIESSGNPSAWTTLPSGRKSQYRGLAQLGPDEERAFGVTDWTDPNQQRAAVNGIWNRNQAFFQNTFGRPPTQAEQYLMHNQGAHGLAQMLSNPDANAASTVGLSHISGNFPRSTFGGLNPNSVSNRDFVNGWTSFFNQAPSAGQFSPGASIRSQTTPMSNISNSYSAQAQVPNNMSFIDQAMGGQGQSQDNRGLLQRFTQPSAYGGLAPLERAGIYLMSIGNPQALAGLSAGSRDAEMRNQMMMRLLGLQMQQRSQDRADRLEQMRMSPKTTFGQPTEQGISASGPAGPQASVQGASGGVPAPQAPQAVPAPQNAPAGSSGGAASPVGLPSLYDPGSLTVPQGFGVGADIARYTRSQTGGIDPAKTEAVLQQMDRVSPTAARYIRDVMNYTADPQVQRGEQEKGYYGVLNNWLEAATGKNAQAWSKDYQQLLAFEKNDFGSNAPGSTGNMLYSINKTTGLTQQMNELYDQLNNSEGLRTAGSPLDIGVTGSQSPGNTPSWAMEGITLPPALGGIRIPGWNVHSGADSGVADSFNTMAHTVGDVRNQFLVRGQTSETGRAFYEGAYHDQMKPSTYLYQNHATDVEAREALKAKETEILQQVKGDTNSPIYKMWALGRDQALRNLHTLDVDTQQRFGQYNPTGLPQPRQVGISIPLPQ